MLSTLHSAHSTLTQVARLLRTSNYNDEQVINNEIESGNGTIEGDLLLLDSFSIL